MNNPAPKSQYDCTTVEPPVQRPDPPEPRRAERGAWSVASGADPARPPRPRGERGGWNVGARGMPTGSADQW